jgi:D,D-heptose 1,7-bisphosphate phosphatase
MTKKAIFLDRDNTLIEDPGYISSPDQVKLLPGVSEALTELRNMGYMLIVVTNQSAVARGIVTEKVLENIHGKMSTLLAHDGAYIDKIYYCPYHPEGVVPKYRKESNLRKPQPGMILRAAEELDIDLDNSWMVGNSPRDITAGLNAGCKTILIVSSVNPNILKPTDPKPDEKAVNIKEVVNIIKMHQRQTIKPQPSEKPPESIEPLPEPQEQVPESTESTEKTIEPPQPEPNPQITEPLPTELTEPQQPQPPQEPELTEQVEEPEAIEKTEPTQQVAEKTQQPEKIQQLLEEILRLLKAMQRESMFSEFSITKLLAGAFQAIVFFCLLISVWFWMDPTRPPATVQTMIGYALVFQLMVVAFYIMKGR